MNIKDRLQFIEKIQQPKEDKPKKEKVGISLEDMLDGEPVQTEFGYHFERTKVYDLEFQHGIYPLSNTEDVTSEIIVLAGNDSELRNFDSRNAIFFDTETTGLAGGSGTYIFLAGLGFFADGKFILKQFFLRDFPDEYAFLQAINGILRKYNNIVSFNGKSYDWPLLQTRFITHRIKSNLVEPPHYDLLHATRRIWKNSLIDCSLGNVERKVLNVKRFGDIPSYLIPQMYFDYLRNKDASSMKSIFYHNEIDILSMVTLHIKIHRVHQSPFHEVTNNMELCTLAKHYENMHCYKKAVPLYEHLFRNESTENLKKEFGIRLGYCYKYTEAWQQAVEIWQMLLSLGKFRIEPFEELAKYFEHRVNDYKQAENIVLRAMKSLDVVSELKFLDYLPEIRKNLNHRLDRIQRKLNNLFVNDISSLEDSSYDDL